ncbi:MAG TPA: Gfo/Idh/MocA family oxidoreductase [Chthoniobacterales bacterium]
MRRGALIGFGEVAQHGHLPAYEKSSEAKIVAIVDSTGERRNIARAFFPEIATFAAIEELAAGAELDFVDICTPPSLHAEGILEGLRHRWHVLCEKPLLLDEDELDEVRAKAKQAQRAVVPVHNWKYAPIVRRATALLRSGAIGRLRTVEFETLRIQDCAVADPAHPNWRRNPAIAGGGILMDHGWHAIYLAQHWFGEAPADVRAVLDRSAPDEVENEARLTLLFPSGEAKIFLTWKASRRRSAMRLIGERGEIAIDDDRLQIGSESIQFAAALSSGSHHGEWFAAMLPDILATFRQPARWPKTLAEAALCLSVIQRAYRADPER